jgi:chromosome partitioning protein
VLVIDVDAQASASSWLGIADGGRGLMEVFTDNGSLADLVADTDVAGVACVPASSWLVGVERALAGEVGAELILRGAIAALPAGAWDFILIDCPPSLGLLSVSALAAVEELLIPIETHVMALAGLAQLLKTVEVVRERLNPQLRVTGILACRVDGRTRHATEVLAQLRTRFGNLVYNTAIRANVRLAEAPSFHLPITAYESRSPGAEDYRALAREVLTDDRSR